MMYLPLTTPNTLGAREEVATPFQARCQRARVRIEVCVVVLLMIRIGVHCRLGSIGLGASTAVAELLPVSVAASCIGVGRRRVEGRRGRIARVVWWVRIVCIIIALLFYNK